MQAGFGGPPTSYTSAEAREVVGGAEARCQPLEQQRAVAVTHRGRSPTVRHRSSPALSGALVARGPTGLQYRTCAGVPRPSSPSPSASPSNVASHGRDLAGYAHKGKKVVAKLSHKISDVGKRLARKTGALTWAFVQNPLIVREWYGDIRDATLHFFHWLVTGSRHFGANVRACYVLIKRVLQGYPLSVKERGLLVRTTSDCLKLIPFSFFIIVPFAELALPFFLRLFPNMLPSTFFEQKYDNATLARKLQAKQEMADFWQQVVGQRTKEISEELKDKFADRAAELKEFQDKLVEGREYPSLKEILRFSHLFQDEFNVKNMSQVQMRAMSKMLGLPVASTWWPGHLEVQLRHHITNLRREDRDLVWEGIENLTQQELIEACRKRAIRFHEVTEDQMRKDLNRWLELSAHHRSIPTSLLLWIQSFYLRSPGESPAETSELELKVAPKEEITDPEEAFSNLAERQKAHAEHAQQRLEDLRHQIEEVLHSHPADGAVGQADGVLAEAQVVLKEAEEVLHAAQEVQEHEDQPPEEKRCMKLRMTELSKIVKFYKEIASMQKDLLDKQLRFLVSMKDNKPTQHKDADVILLDQQIRLMEMIKSFEKSTKEIEHLLESGEPSSEEGTWRSGERSASSTDLDPVVVSEGSQPSSSRAARDPWADLDATPALQPIREEARPAGGVPILTPKRNGQESQRADL